MPASPVSQPPVGPGQQGPIRESERKVADEQEHPVTRLGGEALGMLEEERSSPREASDLSKRRVTTKGFWSTWLGKLISSVYEFISQCWKPQVDSKYKPLPPSPSSTPRRSPTGTPPSAAAAAPSSTEALSEQPQAAATAEAEQIFNRAYSAYLSQNYVTAAGLMKQAADMGVPHAMVEYATKFLVTGYGGVKENIPEAVKLILTAVINDPQNVSHWMRELKEIYMNNPNINLSEIEAQFDLPNQVHLELGTLYFRRSQITQGETAVDYFMKGSSYFEACAKGGMHEDLYLLGREFLYGSRNYQKDYNAGIKLLELSAEGSGKANHELGDIYGGKKDRKYAPTAFINLRKAEQYYKAARDRFHDDSAVSALDDLYSSNPDEFGV